jgi:hypothetical protein
MQHETKYLIVALESEHWAWDQREVEGTIGKSFLASQHGQLEHDPKQQVLKET